MSDDKLRQNLEKLRSELEKPREIEPETQQLLSNVRKDIEHVLGAEESVERPTYDRLIDRLERAELTLEGAHPLLAEAMRRVMNILSSMGI